MTRLAMLAVKVALTFLLVILPAAACATESTTQSTENGSKRTQQVEALTGSAEEFEGARFDDPTHIDNRWLPLTPRTQFVYEGSSIVENGRREEHSIVVTVTDLTKVVDGVRTLVVYDEDYHAGQLLEPEIRFHAQDTDGNVWYFGEYREEYDLDGKLVEPRAWVPHQKGAREGISMPAEPRLDTPSYAEGYAPPPVEWIDRGRVYKVGQKSCVPVDCYKDVLVIEEFERNKPGAYQLKYYAPGVGDVRVGWRGPEEEEKEGLDLVKDVRLSQKGLAEARADALKLEKHAYEIKEFYSKTKPAKPTL